MPFACGYAYTRLVGYFTGCTYIPHSCRLLVLAVGWLRAWHFNVPLRYVLVPMPTRYAFRFALHPFATGYLRFAALTCYALRSGSLLVPGFSWFTGSFPRWLFSSAHTRGCTRCAQRRRTLLRLHILLRLIPVTATRYGLRCFALCLRLASHRLILYGWLAVPGCAGSEHFAHFPQFGYQRCVPARFMVLFGWPALVCPDSTLLRFYSYVLDACCGLVPLRRSRLTFTLPRRVYPVHGCDLPPLHTTLSVTT